MENTKKALRATYFSIAANFGLALLKGFAGILGNSFALIADAIESTSDVFSSFLALIGIKYAAKPADEDHPYGHGKAEALFTFIIVGFLISSAIVIAYQSLENIGTKQKVPETWTLYVLALIILWKEVSFQFVMKKSRETNSSVLKADAWHHRSDAITSIAAFLGITIAIFMGEGYENAEDWVALFAAALILYNAYKIFRPALGEVMDEHLYDDLQDDIKQISVELNGIEQVRRCIIRKSGMNYLLDLRVSVNGELTVRQGHVLAHELEDHLRSKVENLDRIFIHVEPMD